MTTLKDAKGSTAFFARHVQGQANKVGAMKVSYMCMECWASNLHD